MKWFSYVSEKSNYEFCELYNKHKLLIEKLNTAGYSDYIRDCYYDEEVRRRSSFSYRRWRACMIYAKYSAL